MTAIRQRFQHHPIKAEDFSVAVAGVVEINSHRFGIGGINNLRCKQKYAADINCDSMHCLARVVLEPLPFPGNLQQPIDKTLRGKYSFEIVDPDSDSIAWSRSFSSIYGEWETTGEARQMNRTFHESLRFPVQEKEFEIVLNTAEAPRPRCSAGHSE